MTTNAINYGPKFVKPPEKGSFPIDHTGIGCFAYL